MLYSLDRFISRILDAWKMTIHPGFIKIRRHFRRSISFAVKKFGFLRKPFFVRLSSFLYDCFVILSGAALIAVIWYFCFTF